MMHHQLRLVVLEPAVLHHICPHRHPCASIYESTSSPFCSLLFPSCRCHHTPSFETKSAQADNDVFSVARGKQKQHFFDHSSIQETLQHIVANKLVRPDCNYITNPRNRRQNAALLLQVGGCWPRGLKQLDDKRQ